MRKLLLGALVMTAMVAGAWAAGKTAPAKAAKKTHDMKVTVVSVDATAKTMTVKTDTGEEKTAPVMGKAINKMKDVKAGEMITVTCLDNDAGEHQGITDIKVQAAKSHAAKK